MKDKSQEAELLPTQALSKHEPQPLTPFEATPAGMMQQMIRSGVTAENVAAFTELVKLSEHMEDRSAAKEYAVAFNALQAEMPRIQAKQAVPNNDGTTRYCFAPFEHIMEQVQPYLMKHGFTVSFSTRYDGPRVVKICTLRHIGGHSVSNEFAATIGSGPPKASGAQADGAAGTYAKRFALCDALNIVVETDSDARAEGGPISNSQAVSLRKRVKDTGSDESAFLKFAKSPIADTATEAEVIAAYQAIPTSMYEALDANLQRKERTK